MSVTEFSARNKYLGDRIVASIYTLNFAVHQTSISFSNSNYDNNHFVIGNFIHQTTSN